MKTKNVCLLLSIFIAFLKYGWTQEQDSVYTYFLNMPINELMEVEVITASKTLQTLSDAPASMVVITDKMIEERGYYYLEEILHDLPGFDFDKTYGVNYSTIFMRGYRSENSDRFILMFDGILENDIWKQTTWISRQYPVFQIKQIEVLYGPASALYGTNAFSGIINVITKKGDEVGDINIVTTAGTYGRKNIEFSTGKSLDNNISYNISAKYFSQNDLHQWNEFDAIDGRNSNFSQDYLNKIGNEFRFNVDGRLVKENFNENMPAEDFGINLNLKFGDLSFTALNWTKNELEGYFYNPFKRSGPWTQWFENDQGYMLSHIKKINDKISVSSDLTYRLHKILDSKEGSFDFYDAPVTDINSIDYTHSQTIVHADPTTYQLKPAEEVVISDNGDTVHVTGQIYHYALSTWDMAFEEQANYVLSEKLNLIGGFRYTYTNTQEDYESSVFYNGIVSSPRHIKKNIAGYFQAMFKPLNLLTLTLGGRYEDQKDEKNKGYNIFVPRISAVCKLLSENLVLRFQYAESFQEPDDWHKFATDFNLRPYNSSTLEPERLKSLESGVTLKFGEKLLISGTGYYTIVSNFIKEIDNTPANPYHGYIYGYHFENSSEGKVVIKGYEVSFNSKLMKGLILNGNISGAFNYDKNNELIGDIAPLKINMGLAYNYDNKLTIYSKVNYISKKKTINWKSDPTQEPIYTEIDGYAIFGLNVNFVNLFGLVKGLNYNINIDNVLNKKYFNPGSRSADGVNYTARVLQPGRNIMTGLTYRF